MDTLRSALTTLAVAGLAVSLLTAGCSNSGGSFSLGPEARLEFSPTSVDFSDVPRGESAFRIVTVRHIGTGGTIFLSPIALSTQSDDLSLGVVEKTTLEPGEESRIQIIYNSDNDDRDNGELVVGHNLAASSETRIPVTTPGQRASLVADPSTIDFGIVQAGAPKTITIRVFNVGTADATLTGAEVTGDTDNDFEVAIPGGTALVPKDGGTVEIQLTYKPSGADADEGTARITTERDDVSLDIPMQGQEETPRLVVDPNTIQFGWVEPGGQSGFVEVEYYNEGNVELVVDGIGLRESRPEVTLTGIPALPDVLQPGDKRTVGMLFSPDEDIAMSVNPLAYLAFYTNDGAYPAASVSCTAEPCTEALFPAFGAAGVPSIVVAPEDVVDFGFVAEGFEGTRTVTILNVGDAAVDITSAQLVEPTTSEFSFATPEKVPATLNPGDTLDLQLEFSNDGGATGTEFARFVFNSTDPLVPEYNLNVVARRAERPTCEPAFTPEFLSLGAIREGQNATGVIEMVNFGSGNCEYQSFDLDACLKIQSGIRHYYDCEAIGLNPFEITDEPAFGTILGPGDTLFFEVTFLAPEVTNVALGRDQHHGRLTVLLFDPNANKFNLVAPEGGWMQGTNIRAESGIPKLAVSPSELDYGYVRTDCQSNANLVILTNPGPIDAVVTEVNPLGCNGQVSFNMPAELPFIVPGYTSVFVETLMQPAASGNVGGCAVEVKTDASISNFADANVAVIPTIAEGIDVSHQVDTFSQTPPPKVDVLFVVDDSGSMADEQLLLKQELPKMVEIATSYAQSYHLAVTTTDTVKIQGTFKGLPQIATENDSAEDFADNLLVGTQGYWEEMGLEAAWQALSGINALDTGDPCLNVPGQCPKYDDFNYLQCYSDDRQEDCLEWADDCYCRGPNFGFVRDDAELVIIIVSDEEDSSPQQTNWYVNQFSALKKPNSGYGVKVHAIVTDPEECLGSNFGTVGYRYMKVVEDLDGIWTSICASDFGAKFVDIAENTFGLNERFYPTLPVDPGSLQVMVNGVACTGPSETTWQWNEATRSVVFTKAENGGTCWPDYGAEVNIEYDVPCNTPSNP